MQQGLGRTFRVGAIFTCVQLYTVYIYSVSDMTKPSSKRILIGAISPAAEGPLYRQIVDGIRREISAGRLSPGDELPSFRALAEQLLVSLITVKRAYEELEREGIIFRRQGLGTFVSESGDSRSRENKARQATEHLRQGVAEAMEVGMNAKEITQLVTKLIKENKG